MKKERNETNIQIGERIRAVRTNLKLTQERFAELLDVTPQYISDLERGVVGIAVPTLKRLCETFAVSSDTILLNVVDCSGKTELADKISRLSPEQADVLNDVVNSFIEVIAITKKQQISEGK